LEILYPSSLSGYHVGVIYKKFLGLGAKVKMLYVMISNKHTKF